MHVAATAVTCAGVAGVAYSSNHQRDYDENEVLWQTGNVVTTPYVGVAAATALSQPGVMYVISSQPAYQWRLSSS